MTRKEQLYDELLKGFARYIAFQERPSILEMTNAEIVALYRNDYIINAKVQSLTASVMQVIQENIPELDVMK